MTPDIHHEHLIKELAAELEPVFKNSPQAIYLYLDDVHKICNQNFADMLGYKTIKEWVKMIQAYMNASEKFISSTMPLPARPKKAKKLKPPSPWFRSPTKAKPSSSTLSQKLILHPTEL